MPMHMSSLEEDACSIPVAHVVASNPSLAICRGMLVSMPDANKAGKRFGCVIPQQKRPRALAMQ